MALDTLRKGAARTFGLILVALLVVSFAVWGIADIFTGYGRQTLIEVGDTEISPEDYQRVQQEVLRAMSQDAGRALSLQEARAAGLDQRDGIGNDDVVHPANVGRRPADPRSNPMTYWA